MCAQNSSTILGSILTMIGGGGEGGFGFLMAHSSMDFDNS